MQFWKIIIIIYFYFFIEQQRNCLHDERWDAQKYKRVQKRDKEGSLVAIWNWK